MSKSLENITKTLLVLMDEAKDKFEEVKATQQEGDFFNEVKPFADKVKDVNDIWLKHAKAWITEKRPKYINGTQLETTYDHIEKLSIQSFYRTTSRKMYLNSFQSAQFVLQGILQQVEDDK